MLVSPVRVDDPSPVEVYFLNEDAAAVALVAPERIAVRDESSGTPLTLQRQGVAPATIAPGSFAKVSYRVLNTAAQAEAETPPPSWIPASAGEEEGRAASAGASASSGFLDRFAPHEPVYAVFGTGSDAGKLQISAAFEPFRTGTILDGVRIAYTQTSLWAIEEPSSPFRSTIYSPSAFYLLPTEVGGQPVSLSFGYRHDSNGIAGGGSRDVNRLFLRAATRFDLGGDWSLELAPAAWIFVRSGSQIDNYWGYTGLDAAIEQREGLKLSTFLRGNPGTGRGSAEFLASYPLADLTGGLGVYLVGQLFTGYGETLLEFDQRRTRARIGLGLVR